MTREGKADRAGEQDEPTDGLGIIVELAKLPPGTLLTVNGMAQIFGKSPNTIMRAVGEGRLPRPFRIFSENCWRAGDVDVFLQRRMQDAQQRTGEHSQRRQGGHAAGPHGTPQTRRIADTIGAPCQGYLSKKTRDGKWRGWYRSHLTGLGRPPQDRQIHRHAAATAKRSPLPTATTGGGRPHYRRRPDSGAGGPAANGVILWRPYRNTWPTANPRAGRGGRPWGRTHARNQRAQLAWWHEQIGFRTLEDLMNALRPVETALVRLRDRGRTSKTLRNYQESLHSFCHWCVDRDYLPSDPLRRLRKFDAAPSIRRRVLTLSDIAAVMAIAPPDRRLLYEMALFSGLRLGELRHLKGEHLDLDRGGLRLEAEWTKNRRAGFQPLPAHLVAGLARAIRVSFQPAPASPVSAAIDASVRPGPADGGNREGERRGRGGVSFLAGDLWDSA